MFEILEHAADVGFRAEAISLPELFENAAEALVALAMETERIEAHESYPLEAEGEDIDSLLVNWLSEVLYYLDGRLLAMGRFQVSELTGERVRGAAMGERRDPSRHPARLIVKGITYHQLKIAHHVDRWVCEVFLDV